MTPNSNIIQRDVSFQVSSNFLNDEEQTKVQMATVGQEMKNLRSQLQEHCVNAVEGNRTVDQNQRGKAKHNTILAKTDIPQVGAAGRREWKN